MHNLSNCNTLHVILSYDTNLRFILYLPPKYSENCSRPRDDAALVGLYRFHRSVADGPNLLSPLSAVACRLCVM